jgi:hypothetical protein
MDVIKALEEKAFWGHEFLTWLWYRIETGNGEFDLGGGDVTNLWIEDRLVLEALEGESKENIIKSGEVASSPEAAAALAAGKKITQARFGMSRGENTWVFVIDGATFDMKSMKIPAVHDEAEEDDGEATMLVRMGHIYDCVDTIDRLFAEFTALRVSDEWNSQLVASMALWVREKAQASR